MLGLTIASVRSYADCGLALQAGWPFTCQRLARRQVRTAIVDSVVYFQCVTNDIAGRAQKHRWRTGYLFDERCAFVYIVVQLRSALVAFLPESNRECNWKRNGYYG